MDGGTGAGPHMWNVVGMVDELNYLVDVINCDTGSIGYQWKLVKSVNKMRKKIGVLKNGGQESEDDLDWSNQQLNKTSQENTYY